MEGKGVCQGKPSVSTEPIDLESLTEGKIYMYINFGKHVNLHEIKISMIFSAPTSAGLNCYF